MTEFVVATDVGRADGAVALSAAVGVILALGQDSPRVLVVEVGRVTPLRATMLASRAARSLEEELHSSEGPLAGAVARGRVCFLALTDEVAALDALAGAPALLGSQGALVASVAPEQWGPALARPDLQLTAALLRAELPVDRSLAALAVAELHERGLRVRVARQRLGTVPSRRARAGLDPGGPASSRVRRLVRGLLGRPAMRSSAASSPLGEISEPEADSSATEAPKATRGSERGPLGADSGQVLPAVLLAAVMLIGLALAATAILGAVTGKGQQQRAADLIALSAARSMRDDFPRLFAAARRPDGSENPFHLSKAAYLNRAGTAALEAASENSVGIGRVRVEFPDRESFAPVRARVRIVAGLDESESLGAGRSIGNGSQAGSGRGQATPPSGSRPHGRGFEVVVSAVAEAVPMARGQSQAAPGPLAGGYQGSFASRQGKQMRPDVAAAFDALADSGRRASFTLVINSAHRSDAHQAQLFARNPDPRWVAPPGRSLHRCGTELDLGPSTAYAWLAANAPEFGFLKRYAWVSAGLLRASIHCSGGASDAGSASSSYSARSRHATSDRKVGKT